MISGGLLTESSCKRLRSFLDSGLPRSLLILEAEPFWSDDKAIQPAISVYELPPDFVADGKVYVKEDERHPDEIHAALVDSRYQTNNIDWCELAVDELQKKLPHRTWAECDELLDKAKLRREGRTNIRPRGT